MWQNNRLIDALLGKNQGATPLWMMRQAGRYLPEYRAVRKGVPHFMELCKDTDLVAELTLQPIVRFDLDAAIIFSDILTVVDALGFDLEFVSGHGPVIHDPVKNRSDLNTVYVAEAVNKLQYVADAVKKTVRLLEKRVPLIGFAGSPWTVACYLVDGKNHRNQFQAIRTMTYQDPELLHEILALLTQVTIAHLQQQIDAGASAIMLFDTWGGILPRHYYQQFSLDYMQKIARSLHRVNHLAKVPVIFFTKQSGAWLELIADADCDAVGLDWTVDLNEAYTRIGHKVALQGNLDPCALLSSPRAIDAEVARIFAAIPNRSGYVFNLGHGIDKKTPIENVEALIASVRKYGAGHQNKG